MEIYNLVSFIGLFALIALAWLLSARRNVFNIRVVVWGTIMQLVFGAFVFLVPAGSRIFLFLSDIVVKMLNAAVEGARFCFGPLAIPAGEPAEAAA